MKRLTVYYDDRCEFCVECRRWLESEAKHIPLEFASRQRLKDLPGLDPAWGTSDLVVVDDEGGVYLGPKAFIVCLYALRGYRDWAHRLSALGMAGLAEGAFKALSSGRGALSALIRASS